MALLAPSLLAADFLKLGEAVDLVNQYADWFHLDVMDGVFVPNISFGMPVIQAIAKQSKKTLDAHLMIVDPDRYIDAFQKLGVECLTVHYEACTHLNRTIGAIKQAGMKAGVALNPHTSVDLLDDVITDADMVLIMSVNPGFGGQKFIENTYRKIEKTKNLIIQRGSKALIQVDGGVVLDNASQLVACGADVLVAGSSVFNSPNPIEAMNALRHA